MALTKCHDCKKEISRDAKACPHCGKPVKKKGSGCGQVVLILAVLIVIGLVSATQDSGKKPADTSVSPAQPPTKKPVAETPKAAPKTPPPAIESMKGALAETTTAVPKTPAETVVPSPSAVPKPEPLVEPNWDERITYWKNETRGSFKAPTIGQPIEVVLQNGVTQRGRLSALTDQAVSMQMDKATLTFDRKNIRMDIRIKLFAEDYALLQANLKVKAEKEDYLARVREREEQERQEKLAKEEVRLAQEKAQRQEKIKKLFSTWDGSLYSLVQYTKKTMNDPKSFQHAETSFADNGTDLTVRMAFRGKNAFGAMVLNAITVKVDMEGNVVSILKTEP